MRKLIPLCALLRCPSTPCDTDKSPRRWSHGCYHRRMVGRPVIAILALLLPLGARAETFRCGKWIIDTDTSVEELTQKCGPPSSQESKTEEVKAHNRNNGLWVKTGETTTEIWTFDRGPRAAPMVVTIIDGRIKSIERLKK